MIVSDEQLVAAILVGDQAAARRLVERYQDIVFRVCYRIVRDAHDAEDIAQEAFLRAFRSLHRWDSQRPLRPWLLTIAANRCRTFVSTRKRTPAPLESVAAVCAVEQRLPDDLADELQRGLTELRPEYQTCFTLFHLEHLSVQEVAAAMERPEGTIKTWLHRARRELGNYLQQRGLGLEPDDELPAVPSDD